MNIFYFGSLTSGSNACLKRGSNQIYVFIFVENVGDKSRHGEMVVKEISRFSWQI